VTGLLALPGDLLRLPFDYRRAARSITRNPAPGPLEGALYTYADANGLRPLLLDTPQPRNDLKLITRRCDSGEAAACDRIADLFIHDLGDFEIGQLAERQACAAGDTARCLRLPAPQPPGAPFSGGRGRRTALGYYLDACLAPVPIARACRWAANVAPPVAPRIGFVRPAMEDWACEDRACLLGDGAACEALARDFSEPYETVPALTRFYRELLRSPELDPRRWSTELRSLRREVEEPLQQGVQVQLRGEDAPQCFTRIAPL
jgi:hypothetical protein